MKGAPACEGTKEPIRTTGERQAGMVRTTRRLPISLTAAAATSSAVSSPPPECTSAFAARSSRIASTIGVSTPSGRSACTRTPSAASIAAEVVTDSTAAFVAA